MLFLSLFVIGALFGAAGIAMAKNKGVDPSAGFFLGAFLGPIGLIIIALLNPPGRKAPKPKQSAAFLGTPELTNDTYKLWLTSRYNIEKNDVLGAYSCDEKLFPSVETALAYAHQKHLHDIAFREAEATSAEERRLQHNEGTLRQIKRAVPYIIGFCVILAIFAAYHIRELKEKEKKIAIQHEVAREASVDAANTALRPYGIKVDRRGDDITFKRSPPELPYCGFYTHDGPGSSTHREILNGTLVNYWVPRQTLKDAGQHFRKLMLADGFNDAGYSFSGGFGDMDFHSVDGLLRNKSSNVALHFSIANMSIDPRTGVSFCAGTLTK